MPKFEKGTPKPANSGRKAGTPNKLTALAVTRLEELGCDPIEGMVIIAQDPQSPPDLVLRAYSELAQYAYPKRKAIDHNVSGSVGVNVTSATELLRSRLDSIAARLRAASDAPGSEQ